MRTAVAPRGTGDGCGVELVTRPIMGGDYGSRRSSRRARRAKGEGFAGNTTASVFAAVKMTSCGKLHLRLVRWVARTGLAETPHLLF